MIGIINTGNSNIGSIKNILNFLQVKFILVENNSKSKLNKCSKLILPGVGSFKNTMKKIKKKKLDVFLNNFKKTNKPILGICLGMQIMCKYSEEDGGAEGLGWFNLNVKKFDIKKIKKIPVIGWNEVKFKKNIILKDIPNKSSFYFLHSYYVNQNKKYTIGKSRIKLFYSSIISKKNIYGCQFHPEKSQNVGIKLIKNFIEYC